jgi:hypothetical protein
MATDRLDILRAKYLESIDAKEAEVRQLREKLKLIDELENDSQKLSATQAAPTMLKYAGGKLTKVVLDAVKQIGQNGGISATAIRKYISANGYRHPNEKNFPVATVIALTRLAKAGQIYSTKEDGKRIFKKRSEMPPPRPV